MNITFIGGGNMAKALIGGLLQKGFAPDQLKIVQTNKEKADKLHHEFSVPVFSSVNASIVASEIIILAVKPQQIAQAAKQLAPFLKDQLIISVAAGIRLSDLSRWLNNYKLLARAMPNTPALVQAGITGLFVFPGVSTDLKEKADKILNAVGSVIWLQSEEQLDYITAISGSGPAYVFYFMQALEEVALEFGFDKTQACRLARYTFSGAVRLALESTEDVTILRQRVTSKGGTTERAIDTMEKQTVKNNIIEAIRAAAKRAQELGAELGNQN